MRLFRPCLPSRLCAGLLLALGAMPAAAAAPDKAPDYGGASASQCIPFANPQPVAFTDPPKLNFSIGDSTTIHTVTMDTGSVGIALAAPLIPGFEGLKAKGSPGTQFLSSSKVLWVGTWVPVTVTLYDRDKRAVATAAVPVLGVERTGYCPAFQKTGQICTDGMSPAKDVVYMGVGFGQEADFQPQGTPDKNALLNLTSLNGKPIAPGSLNPGYIIGRQGIQVGLTAENSQGFRFTKLEPYAAYPGDWMMPQGCYVLNPEQNRTATGPICTPTPILVDTGIPQSYMTVPTGIRFDTVEETDKSDPKRKLPVLAPGTVMEIRLPASGEAIAAASFTMGHGSPVQPAQVIPDQTDKYPPFLNTGRHFLRQVQYLYDARQGYVGMKPQPNPCGEG